MAITLGIVEVPSSRSGNGKHSLARRKFGDSSLLEWVIRRVTESLLIEHVIVVADAEHRDALRPLVPSDATLFDGAQPDQLARFAAAIRETDATSVVRVPVDRPFIDPSLIDRLICDSHAHPGCDYISYVSNKSGKILKAQLGVFGEWCRAEAVLRADHAATAVEERLHATRYIYSHPEEFQLRLIPAPEILDRDDIRLTIEEEEDWEHAHLIFDALGPDQIDWQRIADLLVHQPELRRRMADLNQADVASS
jgi:spore coat polysaccharide biosynthesis protein SpsF (cytidylyltransferase family)